ncbi:MAG: amidohydrolase family protein [Candidatus Azambacteria bacterium]|nr:amidohydrolase family protein [Candidatus Azambacteria bacterium]
MYDLIIKNGTVIDGSGTKEKFMADVAVHNGVIVRVGAIEDMEAKKIIDAEGLYVTPGFIDVLSHSDTNLTLFTMPGQESLISQGVTTIIGGNCGYSLAPLISGNVIDAEQRWTDPAQINVDWLRMSEFLEKLEEKKLAVNFGTLTGYNTLIKGILKNEYRQPSRQENEIASFLLDQSLQEGSGGMSIGFAYLYQDKNFADHLESLFATVKKQKKIIAIHLKDESNTFLDSLHATIALAREFDSPLHISHLKVVGKRFWHNFQKAIQAIEEASASGVSVTFDMFPYASSALALYLLLPAWVKVGGPEMIMKRLKNSFERAQVIKDLAEQAIDYERITIASRAPDGVFVGKTLAEIAKGFGTNPEEAIIQLLLGSNLKVIVFAHVLNEGNIQMGVAHPLSIIGSSGAGYSMAPPPQQRDLPHPRSFGTFPRFLRKYVVDKKLLSWEHAIAKITGTPARLFGVKRRGILKEGNSADIVVFDPRIISDVATFQNPYQYSKGVEMVLVNGACAYEKKGFTHAFSGKVIRFS